jgi:hypothetical protein
MVSGGPWLSYLSFDRPIISILQAPIPEIAQESSGLRELAYYVVEGFKVLLTAWKRSLLQ